VYVERAHFLDPARSLASAIWRGILGGTSAGAVSIVLFLGGYAETGRFLSERCIGVTLVALTFGAFGGIREPENPGWTGGIAGVILAMIVFVVLLIIPGTDPSHRLSVLDAIVLAGVFSIFGGMGGMFFTPVGALAVELFCPARLRK
jgi:hypothetical protein